MSLVSLLPKQAFKVNDPIQIGVSVKHAIDGRPGTLHKVITVKAKDLM